MSDLTLKLAVVGPCKTGKTLLCRALAEQPILQGEYHPTAAVRCVVEVLQRWEWLARAGRGAV